MKLLYGVVSPFTRKVTVTLHELGLAERVELIPSPLSATPPNANVVAHNPLGKIPTLILDDGEVLYDSILICEYLAHLSGDARLFPAGPDRWRALRLNALADGLLDAGILARIETTRPAEMQ
jgi:glutathione S-transferase